MMISLEDLAQMHRLRELHVVRGWRVQLKYAEEPPHELEELVYSLHHGEWLDVLRILGQDEALAGRFLTESVLSGRNESSWLRTGHLDYVLNELAELPLPDTRLAPHLVRSRIALPGR